MALRTQAFFLFWSLQEVTGETTAAAAKASTLPRDGKGNLLVSVLDLLSKLCSDALLKPMPWFHGKISRELAESLLTPHEDGLYLVRESTNFPGDYTLCVCSEAGIDHYRVQGKDGKLTIDDESYFGSLEELIKVSCQPVHLFFFFASRALQHYEQDSDGLCTRLRKPLVKKDGLELVCACAL